MLASSIAVAFQLMRRFFFLILQCLGVNNLTAIWLINFHFNSARQMAGRKKREKTNSFPHFRADDYRLLLMAASIWRLFALKSSSAHSLSSGVEAISVKHCALIRLIIDLMILANAFCVRTKVARWWCLSCGQKASNRITVRECVFNLGNWRCEA